jgi:hypothetical protein
VLDLLRRSAGVPIDHCSYEAVGLLNGISAPAPSTPPKARAAELR